MEHVGGTQPKSEIITDNAVNMWNAMKLIRGDSLRSVGSSVAANGTSLDLLSDDTVGFLKDYKISSRLAASMVNTHVEYDIATETLIENRGEDLNKQFYRYFDHFQTDHELEKAVSDALERNKDKENFFLFLQEESPIAGTAALLLYDYARVNLENPEYKEYFSNLPKETRPFSEWYKESIDQAFETQLAIDSFFSRLMSRAEGNFENTVVRDFVKSLQHDLQLNVVDLVSMASAMGIHVREEDCAMYMSTIPVHVKKWEFDSLRKEVVSLWGDEPGIDDKVPLFRQYSPKILEYNEQLKAIDEVLVLPAYISVVDLYDFFKFYNRFWQQTLIGLKSGEGYESDKDDAPPGASVIYLGKAASLLLRPQEVRDNLGQRHQARLAIRGQRNFKGFNIRVDREERYVTNNQGIKEKKVGLSLDIGGLKREQVLDFAHKLQANDNYGEGVIGYASNIDESGKFKQGAKLVYPKIRHVVSDFEDENVAALVIALAMNSSQVAGVREGEAFSYHAKEEISLNPLFVDMFPEIINSLRKMLARRK